MRRIVFVLAALAVAGCGDIPQPFRHAGRGDDLAKPDFTQSEDQPETARPPHRLTARLGSFQALPGDGGQALRRAVKGALERRGLLVVGDGGDVVVTPRIEVAGQGSDLAILDVTWVVTSVEGAVLGQAKQQGSAAFGVVNGTWGTLARDIAEGGADGIVRIVQSAFTKGRSG